MKLIQSVRRNHEINNQYVFFHLIHTLTGLLVWSYYGILLMRNAETPIEGVPLVIQYFGMFYLGLALGFFVCGRILPALGYKGVYRLANGMHVLITLGSLILLPNILSVFMFISVLHGTARGIFWNATHMYNTNEIHGQERSRWVNLLYSLDIVLGVVIPVLAGAMISSYGYELVFLLGVAIYLIGLFYPWKFNLTPKDKLHVQDFVSLTHRKGFKRWSALRFFEGLLGNLRVMVFSVLPFLFIGDEFGVGALTSAVGLLGAFIVFMRRNSSMESSINLGFIGATIVTISTTALLLIWSLPILVIRSLVAKLGFSLYNPVAKDLNYRLRELVLGDFRGEYSSELQQYAELYLVFARTLNITGFIVAYYVFNINIETILMVMLGLTVFLEPINLYFASRLNNELKIGSDNPQTLYHPIPAQGGDKHLTHSMAI